MSNPPLLARKDESWYAMCIEPSITKTPVGPVQVPVPYQVISDLSKAMGTSTNVMLNGNPAYLLDQSKMPKCMGDEQGTSGGIRSGMTSGEVKPTSGSTSFKINGKSPVRAGDTCTLNKGNCKGKFIKGSPPSKDPSESKEVRVQIIPSQNLACPDGPIELKAIVTPAGTPFQWVVSAPYELVDAQGNPVRSGSDTAYLRIKERPGKSPAMPGNTPAEVSVIITDPSAQGRSASAENS